MIGAEFKLSKVQEELRSIRALQLILIKAISSTLGHFFVSLCRKHSSNCWLEGDNRQESVVDYLMFVSSVG